MRPGSNETVERGVEDTVEAPRRYGTVGPIVLYDRREGLSSAETAEIKSVVSEIFNMISTEGSCIPDSEIEIDGVKVDEIYVAQEIERNKRIINEETTKQKHDEPHNPALVQQAFTQLGILARLKKSVLTRGLASRLKGESGKQLEATITERIMAIQAARKEIGRALHPQDAFITLVYEFVYENYLWRDRMRKDGKTSYFDSHLIGAVDELTAHNLVGLPRTLSGLKHDTIEDLLLHREDFSPGSKITPRHDFLFCDELYRDKFTGTTSGESPSSKLKRVKREVFSSVCALTKRDRRRSLPDEDKADFRRRRDQAVLIRVYEQMSQDPYAAAVKVCEQPQNALTLGGLEDARALEKLAMAILPHWAALARVLQLEDAHKKLVGAGVDYYDRHHKRDIRGQFNRMQREGIMRILGTDDETCISLLLQKLFGNKITLARLALAEAGPVITNEEVALNHHVTALLESFDNNSAGAETETTRLRIRDRIQDLFEPIRGDIDTVLISPTPLEDFITLSELQRPDYCPAIPEDHPLFEVVVLARSDADLFSLRSLIEKVSGFRIFKGPLSVTPIGMPNRGIMLYLTDDETQLTIPIRINTSKREAESKRGILQDPNRPLPSYIKRRIKLALREAGVRGPQPKTPGDVLRLIEKIVLRQTIVVTTDPPYSPGKPVKHEKIALPEGATVLDFIAALPPGIGIRALHCRLHFDDEPCDDTRFDLGWVSFATDERFGDLVERFFKRTCPAETSFESGSIARAEKHIVRLADIFGLSEDAPLLRTLLIHASNPFGVNDCTISAKLSEFRSTRSSQKKEDLLREIASCFHKAHDAVLSRVGTGRFDPLKVFAFYVDRKASPTIALTVTDEPGILGEIGNLAKSYGLNISHIDQSDTISDIGTHLAITFDPPNNEVGNEDVLKFILRLAYLDFVDDVHTSPNLFDFPENIQTFNTFAEACTDPQTTENIAKFRSPTKRAPRTRSRK